MRFIPIVACLVLPMVASGHHSRAEFDQEARELAGTLVRILWRNPHPAFTIEVDEDGQAGTWQVEGWSSLYAFDRTGITRDRFEEGDKLRVVGLPSTRRAGRMLATHMLLADGTEAILKRDAEPYFSRSNSLGGQDNWDSETRAAVVNASAENRGIFRVWSYPSPDYRTTVRVALTEAAQAARADVDVIDNFVMRCEQKGMPQSMTTPNPYELIDEGDVIRIRGYEGDVVRTVYMTDPPDSTDVLPSRQGVSVGRWEDERTLVIHTSRIDASIPSVQGVLLSEDVEVIERYTLSGDQSRLDYHITAVDPDVFSEPATFEYYWLALGEEFGLYECDVH